MRRLTQSLAPRKPQFLSQAPLAPSPIEGNIGEVVLKILTKLASCVGGWLPPSSASKAGTAQGPGRAVWEGEFRSLIVTMAPTPALSAGPAGAWLGAGRRGWGHRKPRGHKPEPTSWRSTALPCTDLTRGLMGKSPAHAWAGLPAPSRERFSRRRGFGVGRGVVRWGCLVGSLELEELIRLTRGSVALLRRPRQLTHPSLPQTWSMP